MDTWIIPTICTIVAMCVGYVMGVYAPWLDRRESLRAQQEQLHVNAQKPAKQSKAKPAPTMQQQGATI
jgi:hypothetical protein